MLVSPIRVHNLLAGLLDDDGPHTALLITPPGMLISQATLDEEGSEPNGATTEPSVEGEDAEDGSEEEERDDSGSEDDDDDDDEPYLEGPERLRLLLGLASQWEDDESPRVECETVPRHQPRHDSQFNWGTMMIWGVGGRRKKVVRWKGESGFDGDMVLERARTPVPPAHRPRRTRGAAAQRRNPGCPPPHISNFVLVLNGTAHTPWATLAAKADEFLSQW